MREGINAAAIQLKHLGLDVLVRCGHNEHHDDDVGLDGLVSCGNGDNIEVGLETLLRVCGDDDCGDGVIAKFDAELATLCSVPIHIYHANFEISESRFGDSNQHMFYVYSTNSP